MCFFLIMILFKYRVATLKKPVWDDVNLVSGDINEITRNSR